MEVESKDTTSEESSTSAIDIVIELYKSHKNKIKGLIASLILALLLKINIGDNESR